MRNVDINRMKCIRNLEINRSILKSYLINNVGDSCFELCRVSQVKMLFLNLHMKFIQSVLLL